MHVVIVTRILSILTTFVGLTMLLPIPFSLYYDSSDTNALLTSAGISVGAGLLGLLFTRKKQELRPKEGFAVVTFGWIIMSLAGCLPFVISGEIPSFTDAFFETISGFTTTGATILVDIEGLSHGLMFWRCLTHWLGGMGIIVLSLAILPFLGIGGMQLFKAEVPGPVADKLTPRITETAKILWGVYVLMTVVQAVLLWIGDMSLFDALCHSFSTLATGGYSTKNASVAAFQSGYIHWVIIFFMIAAGTNFALHFRFFRGDYGSYWRNSEFRFYIIVILAVAIIIGMDVYFLQGQSVDITLRDTLFQIAAILTTTGFATADYEQWSLVSQMLLFLLMFVGGCAGSTGGGMKIIRIYILIKFIFSEFVRLVHPQAVVPVRIGDIVVPRKVLVNIFGFFAVFMMFYVIGVILMSALGQDFPTSISIVVATLGNVGPGLGTIGPTENYAHLPAAAKWSCSFFMLLGRLEIFTVIILLSPRFWNK